MQGIQSLMPGQAQQAPMPGMMPKPGASTPPAQVKFLETKPSKELRAMYNQEPSLALLTAYTKAVEREELDASMRGQQAMQQAAGAPTTLADAIMSRPVMAAHGGIMQGYAGGGAVAFGGGGNPTVEQILKKAPSARTPEENEILRASGVEVTRRALPEGGVSAVNKMLEGPFFRRLFTGDAYKLSPEELSKRTDAGATTERMFRALGGSQFVQPTTAPAAALTAATQMTPQQRERFSPPAAAAAPPGAADRTGPGPGPGPGAGNRPVVAAAPPPTVPTQGLQNLVDLDKAKNEELAVIQGRQAVDPTVLAARKAEREGAEGIATGRQTRSQAQLTEAQRLRDEALQRSQGDIFSDPEALLRIASGIDTRKGRGIGSLAGGVADIMGQRRSEAAAARKDFQTAQNLHNQELNALDTLRQLQRERDTAIAAGDVTAARAIQDQITSVNRFYQKAKEDRQTAERNYQLDVLKTQATRDQAQAAITSANRPTEFQQKMDLFRKDPAAFEKMYGAKEKSSYDTINDNAQKKFSDWATSPKGMTASAEDRNAMWQEILNREIDTAKRFGIKTPEGAAGPTTGGTVDKNNPLLK